MAQTVPRFLLVFFHNFMVNIHEQHSHVVTMGMPVFYLKCFTLNTLRLWLYMPGIIRWSHYSKKCQTISLRKWSGNDSIRKIAHPPFRDDFFVEKPEMYSVFIYFFHIVLTRHRREYYIVFAEKTTPGASFTNYRGYLNETIKRISNWIHRFVWNSYTDE